jgi:hypothetical protein
LQKSLPYKRETTVNITAAISVLRLKIELCMFQGNTKWYCLRSYLGSHHANVKYLQRNLKTLGWTVAVSINLRFYNSEICFILIFKSTKMMKIIDFCLYNCKYNFVQNLVFQNNWRVLEFKRQSTRKLIMVVLQNVTDILLLAANNQNSPSMS